MRVTQELQHDLVVERDTRWALDRFVFEARDGPGSELAPVRMFLGTEPSQWRAERVFLWSVGRFADPRRRYEITRMANLPDFDTRGWTTGFTNYRFGIPDFCEGVGRAIYNDVDQIYLADAGLLFDLPLAPHGFLARSDSETSVMMMDCAGQRGIWNVETARRYSKKQLHRAAARAATTRGPLDARWNARDGEHDDARPGVLHFTTLHTQPWRPFPHHFVYEPHPLQSIWSALEDEANEAGFELYREGRPSASFASWLRGPAPATPPHADAATSLFAEAGINAPLLLDGAGLREALRTPSRFPAAAGVAVRADWETLPNEDLNWVLRTVFRAAGRVLVLEADDTDEGRSRKLEGRVRHVSKGCPSVTWHLRSGATGEIRVANGGPAGRSHRGLPPRVWVLRDDRAGNTTQALGLAEALAWPAEEKALSFDAKGSLAEHSRREISAPWPDLVIAAGERNARVAQMIRDQSGGTARLVQLGRKGGANADRFDLAVTPMAARLWPHPRRLETRVPLCRETAAGRESPPLFSSTCALRVALLVGGSTGRLAMTEADIAGLAEQLAPFLESQGAQLYATTSRRSPSGAAEAIRRALPTATIHTWRPNDPANPYGALLEQADCLVVTAESESMLAEAAATRATLVIAPVGTLRAPTLWQRAGERIVEHARRRPENERGTPLPQRGFVRRCARWVATGRVRPLRDLHLMHETLVACGRAHLLEDLLREPRRLKQPVRPLREAPVVAERVRSLFGQCDATTTGFGGAPS